MGNFQKWLYTVAAVPLLAALTVPANAQTSQVCIGGAVNPTVRAEGYTELAGDVAITCAGGIPAAASTAVPAATITVSMNTVITSKITSTGFTPNFNEVLLLIDEPGADTTGNAINNCGSGNAPFDLVAGVGVCVTQADANGSGATIYNGTFGHPNVFQGRQVPASNNQIIQFIGVPLDGGTHTLRITNLRASSVFLSGGRVSNVPPLITFLTVVTITSPNLAGSQVMNVANGALRNGLDSVTGSVASLSYLQCSFTGTDVAHIGGGSITLQEGFPSAWRVRNWRQINDNGQYAGTPDRQYNGTNSYDISDMVQNVPGAFYVTESGFMFPANAAIPAINPPLGISNATGTPAGNSPFASTPDTGIASAGTVSSGTRFAIRLANIPAGVTITVPGQVDLLNVNGGNITGRMLTVGNPDANGAGGSVGFGDITTYGANFTVIYEVIFEDPLALEGATVNLTANVSPFDGTNLPLNISATAQAGFAPWYDNAAGSPAGIPLPLGNSLSGAAGPLPRFVTGFLPAAPISLFSFAPCAGLTGSIASKSGPPARRDWAVTLTNNGAGSAGESQITGLTLTQTSGVACTPVVATPFPVSIGDLAATASGAGHVTIDFHGCHPLNRFTVVLSFSSDSGAVSGSTKLLNLSR